MLRLYGYLGLALILFAEINFSLVIMPFASWYIVIVWYGYILFIDSLVYKIKKKSLISTYPKEFLLMLIVSLPFWLLFEFYNTFTLSWYYINYVWYVHLLDFTTIMPGMMETFSLLTVLNVAKAADAIKKRIKPMTESSKRIYLGGVRLLVVVGAVALIIPFIMPDIGFLFIWIGLFLLADPINYLTGRISVIGEVAKGNKSILPRLFYSGIIMGFLWEFWNWQAYPKWMYSFPGAMGAIKLFEMPLFGYLGYLPFALEVFLIYALVRPFFFKGRNDLIAM
jgi:hypothetical protein